MDCFDFQNKISAALFAKTRKAVHKSELAGAAEKQLVPVVLSRYTSPDDMADREEQREAHRRKKHKLRGQLWGNIREKKKAIKPFSDEAKSSAGHKAKKERQQAKNPDLKDSCRALPVLSLREYATL